jgi:hypothetical protein
VDTIISRCIERTLALLGADDQRMFRRLGLTAGSFTLDLAAACAGSNDVPAAELSLGRLVDHGLVTAGHGRFDMLSPVRDAATALLHRDPDSDPALHALLDWIVHLDGADPPAPSETIAANLDTCVHLAWAAVHHPFMHARAAHVAKVISSTDVRPASPTRAAGDVGR